MTEDSDLTLFFNAKVSIFDVIDEIQSSLSPDEIVDIIDLFLEDRDVEREFNSRNEREENEEDR